MFRRFLRIGVPFVAAMLAVGVFAGAASATKAHTAKKTYTIGYEGPLSGGNAALGLLQNNAVKVAINFANEGKTFKNLPFKLKFTEADDQGSGTNSPAAANELITNKNVVAVVGPAFSGATKAAEPLFAAAHMATVSPSATNPALAKSGWHNFFRVVADDNVQGPSDADYIAKGLKAKNVYVINDASDYGAGVAGAVATRLKHDGVTIESDTVDGTTQCAAGTGDVTEYPPEAQKIVDAKPDVVYYGGYYCDFALLAEALRSAGYTGQLFSDDGSEDPHYIIDAGASVANGTLISSPGATLGTTKLDKEFAAAFKKAAGNPPGEYSPESFDSTNVIIYVMKYLATHHKAITRANIVTQLHKTAYKGITKIIKFKTDGNIFGGTIYVYKVVNGVLKNIGTTKTLTK